MITLVTAAPAPDWRLAVVLVLLVGVAVVASLAGGLGVGWAHPTAAARAVVQLAVVSAVIAATLQSLWWSLLFVLLMYAVATVTSARRIDVAARDVPWVGAAIGAGALPVVGLSLVSGVIPFNGAGIIPFAGIVIGGTMVASTLTGRRACAELHEQRGTYEAALALGLVPTDAALLVTQPSASEALVPGMDQTRTVGLVTLPGAFVGVLLGGGTPLEAGAAQVLVLIGLMAGQAITCALLLRLVASRRVLRRDLVDALPT